MISLCLRHSAANFHDNISHCQKIMAFLPVFRKYFNKELSSCHKNDNFSRNCCEKQAQFPQKSIARKLKLFCSSKNALFSMFPRRDFIFRFFSGGHKFITAFFRGYNHRPLIQNALLPGGYDQDINKTKTNIQTDRKSDK